MMPASRRYCDMKRIQQGILYALLIFFSVRTMLALWAWVTDVEIIGPYWGGPHAWMLLLWLYVYLPVCVLFLGYTVYLLIRGQWRHRLLGVNWVLFFVAVTAEVLYLRS